MAHPKMLALHTAVPATVYTQDEITDFYIALLGERGAKRARALRAVMKASGVAMRHGVVDQEFYLSPKSTKQRNDRYMEEAVPLAERLIYDGLARANVDPRDITSFIVVSCTGFNTPGLDLLLAGRLGMSHQLSRTNVLGMGCYGAFPGLRRAFESVTARPDGLALVLTIELCTLHLQFDDSIETIVSTSLFADGAAMALIGGSEHDDTLLAMPVLIDAETYCDYNTLDHMSFTVTDEGFRMYLSSYVPDVLAANVNEFAARLLDRHGLRREDIRFWGIHPGSKRIVEYLQEQLDLTDEQVCFSLDTLSNYGNMSSATVLFVLDNIIRNGAPQPGDYGVLMAFGPGLTMESLLVQW